MKKSKTSRVLQRLKVGLFHPVSVILGTAILVAPFFYLCAFTHPANDDFGSVRWTNFLAYQSNIYRHWTGRFFSTAVISLDPIHWHVLAGFKWAAAILLFLFAIISIRLIERMIAVFSNANFRKRLFLSAAAFILLINNFPSLAEGIYWYCGAITYTLGALFLTGFALQVLNVEDSVDFKNSFGKTLLAVVLLTAAIGSNETIIPVTVAFCVYLIFVFRKAGQKAQTRFFIYAFLGCAIAAAVVILAPGNQLRLGIAPPRLQDAIPAWLSWSYYWWIEILLNPFLTLYTALFIALGKDFQIRKKLPPLIVLFAVPPLVLLASTFPSFWSMGHRPPYRALNAIFIIFLFTWIVFVLKLNTAIHTHLQANQAKAVVTKSVLAIVFGMLMFFQTNEFVIKNSNFFIAARNLKNHTAQDYDAFLKQRYLLVKNSLSDTVFVPPIPQKRGNLLFFADLNTDPTSFPNPDFAAWLGKKFVARIPDSIMVKNGR